MLVDISIGELIDKISILSIKLERIKEQNKLNNISKEYNILLPLVDKINFSLTSPEYIQLKKINEIIWDTEEKIRKTEIPEDIIVLARIIHEQNDERARVKKIINVIMSSDIVEEKSYKGM